MPRSSRRSTSVFFTRDLVSEPANVLYPVEFARRAKAELTKVGVKVEILGEAEMKKLGMNVLLAVGQGSRARIAAPDHDLDERPQDASSRSPWSARASASTPAASRSSPPAAWKT